MSQSGSHMLTSSSRKRHHFSSCCSKHSKRSRSSHRRRRSPSSSSSSSYWTSDEDGFCPSGKWRRSQRESRQAVRSERRHGEVVQQRLEAQQQAIQLQWAILEKRIEALERKGAEAVVSFPTSAQTIHLHASIPKASTCSQESEQRDLSGSVSKQLVTESISRNIVKQEEEPSSITSAMRPLSDGDGEGEDASLSTVAPCSSVGRAWRLQRQGCGFVSHGGPV
ncbi:uncharacterized protein LOC121541672 isoform X1 [Coregonus clupeaformis]|uniref:uncharacterized protein LOC121541672 isoform X1 n=1 Tax=Coregonus clupeaformis TaxID=59861 RepID=UPI001BE0C706|nr:uncharacterized protein LOC121541672 isoform X1 [Coregonus clupeaformis]